MSFTEEDIKRMRWHSRRGMLELDLILVPFADRQLALLDEDHLHRYRLLLAQEDQDLFGWFMQRERPADPELAQMVDFILASHAARTDVHAPL